MITVIEIGGKARRSAGFDTAGREIQIVKLHC
jgi:hypothetical protein